jgi:hypothetical protein
MSDRSERDIETRHRATTADARRIAGAESGIEAPAPDQEDDNGVTDLGQTEPAVDVNPGEQTDGR